MQLSMDPKYKSIYSLMSLPPLKPLQSFSEHLFPSNEPTAEQAKFINNGIRSARDQLIEKMQNELMIYGDTKFDHKFVESKFPNVPHGSKNEISYQQKNLGMMEEDTFADRLSPEQIAQIKQNGEFQVKSRSEQATIPYTWKINDCLLKGRVNRVNIWEDGLAWCYSFMLNASQFFVEVIPESCKKLAYMPVQFFDLIFGKKTLSNTYTPDYQREVYKDFWADIMNKQLANVKDQIGHEFFDLLYLYYDPALYKEIPSTEANRKQLQRVRQGKIDVYNAKHAKIEGFKSSLKEVERKFQENWIKIRKNILTKISNSMQQYQQKTMMLDGEQNPLSSQLLKKDQTIVQKFHQQKYLLYTTHLKQNISKKDLSPFAMESLFTLISIFSLIDTKLTKKNEYLNKIAQKMREKIREENSIRAREYRFVEKMMVELYGPVQRQVQEEFWQSMAKDLAVMKGFTENYASIYKKYLLLIKQFQQRVQQKKKSLKSLYVPQRYFSTSYILFPPYQVVNSNGYYTLKKSQQLQMDTGTHFWKCSLYFMRLRSWSMNCLKVMIGLSWASPLGFRCLCGIEDFVVDEEVYSGTGQKREEKRKTLLGVFGTVMEGIRESRAEFQALPDLGLFGKNCSRICNILECYIFRFFIVGIIGVLVLYPIAIIFFSTVCLLIGITFWIWVPLAMVLVYLFNILVFQFECGAEQGGCLIRGIPLLGVVGRVVFYVMSILVAFVFLPIIAPLICFLYILLLIIQRGLRTFTDTVMLCLISCLGRTPSRDTAIATKISGPGMSRSYFYSINEEDVYVLVQAALEKCMVGKLVELTRKEIEENVRKYNGICGYVFKPFGHSRPSLTHERDIINRNNTQVLNNLNEKYQRFLARYPRNPSNIRFTQEEIQLYLDNSTKIVRNFVEKNVIQDWVFEEKGLLHEDYDQLTRYFWKQIFNCGEQIFEPLQKIDSRFQLVSEGNTNRGIMNQKVTSIVNALKGQVSLSEKHPVLVPAKISLLQKDRPLKFIQQICQIYQKNHKGNISVNLGDPSCIFVGSRNIKEACDYDGYILEIAKGREGVIQE